MTLAIATLDHQGCPDCGTDLAQYEVEQDALFFHGGYGATNRTVQLVCPDCGWSMVQEVSEVRPPRSTT